MSDRILEKLSILADAAKYDVSCASSGSKRKNENKGLGNTGNGICHAYTEDGRCVSLLKILLTNHCIFDCAYCVSRKSNDIKRAAFTVQEVVDLTINFYRRNYIEGLFLSSGIFKNADYTMERLVLIAKKLRQEHNFNGYIHLKAIPGASDAMLQQAGLYADRLSINVEMPTVQSLKLLAPDKNREDMIKPMQYLKEAILENRADKKIMRKTPLFAPAGQSTQMVIGATPESDLQILLMSDQFYKQLNLKRVYYSGYVPVSNDNRLPAIGTPVPMIRENRLYQADWLLRFYGFKVGEIVNANHPHLDMDIDPKLSWALRNFQIFPVDINKADLQLIVRIPGIGVSSAKKIVAARKFTRLTWEHLKKIGLSLNRAKHFITCQSKSFDRKNLLPLQIKQQILSLGTSKYEPNFFATIKNVLMAILIYDGTFEGCLTAVFEVYEYKFTEAHITIKEKLQPDFFGTPHVVITDQGKASRVWNGLGEKLSRAAQNDLYRAFLSEIKGIEDTLLQYAQYAFKNKFSVERDYSNETILRVVQTAKKVAREKHRMEAFIRFQLTKDGMYYAICQPDFNVLPLIEKHFTARYADQRWLIYDAVRKYGLYYDLKNVEMVKLSFTEQNNNGKNISGIYDDTEILYQQLWQQYFTSVNIASRKNAKLHIQHMPKRYWKFLPEKIG